MNRAAWIFAITGCLALMGCASESPFVDPTEDLYAPIGPEVYADDPCDGVPPQLCRAY